MRKVFFDHISTTPLHRDVREAIIPFYEEYYGNPSSHIHEQGQYALRAMDGAREKVAGLIHATPEEVVFTSGATECNNLAIKGVGRAMKNKGKHLIVSEVEHFSVLNALIPLINEGYEVTYLKVDRFGLINVEELKREIRDETVLISVMHANSEIGTIMPVEDIGAIARERNVCFHCDATATVGHIPVNVEKIGADLLTISAHNFYGPKGVGALFIRGGTQIEPLFDGGFQEHGQRAGTENVPGIVGLGKAAEIALVEMEEDARWVRSLENQLRDGLMKRIDHIHFTGHPTNRLPGHVSFWVEFAEGESLLIYLNIHGVMAASGSACSSNLKALDEEDLVASHVLKAIGVPSDICTGSITFSMGKWNTSAEVDYVLEIMPGIVQKLWEMSPSYSDYLKSQVVRR